MNWQKGRQGDGYFKLKLFESKIFKFDVYLLKFEPTGEIGGHTDACPTNYVHHRLNIILKRHGGLFWKSAPNTLHHQYDDSRIVYFKPSEEVHGLATPLLNSVFEDKRVGYWLSIGWLTKRKQGRG